MAKVFVALYNFCRHPKDYTAMPPFFESFLNGLKEAGNDVCCFQTKKVTNRGFEQDIPEKMREMVLKFDPDLCIFFNNNFWDITELVECPIVIYDVDSPLEWQLIDNLREGVKRYLFVYNQSGTKQALLEDFNAVESQCRWIPFFSEIRADKTIKNENDIVFLGANWIWKGYDFLNRFIRSNPSEADIEKAKDVLAHHVFEPFAPSHEIYYELENRPHDRINFGDLRRCAIEISGYRRIQVLSAISDLGLKIYGSYWTIEAMNYYPDVLSCVRHKMIWTKEETERLYNSSKIALNTKHIHAKNGYSFRVCDILASNACLVSEAADDFKTNFPNTMIPMFDSPVQAREQCIKLLKNESMRTDIVCAVHEEIEKNFRFKNVLESLEDFTGITLRGCKEGSLYIFPQTAQDPDIFPAQADTSKNIKRINEIYYNTIGRHLGYDPYHHFRQKKIMLGKLPLFKVLEISKSRKEIYLACLPIVSCNNTTNSTEVHLLLLEKVKNMFRKIRRKIDDYLNRRYLADDRKKESWKKVLRKKIESGEKITICLFVSRINCWMFEDIYKILSRGKVFEPVIVVKPFLSRGVEHMKTCMSETYNALVQRGYTPIRGYDEETDTYLNVRAELNPDILFYTKAWRPHFHPDFYIDNFRDRMTLLIDYGYNVSSHFSAMNFPLQNAVDMYFFPAEKLKEMASHHMDNHAKNVVISGAPKLDLIFDKTYKPVDVWRPQDRCKKRIIWAPHHEDKTSKKMYQLDAFYDLYEVMLHIAEKYKDKIQIAFRPHPLLKVKLFEYWGEAATESYYKKWAEIENGQLSEGEFIDLFLTSDAMILDCLSFIAEYTATCKPALFTVGSNSRVMLNEFGAQIYELVYHAEGDLEAQICEFVESVVIGEHDPLYQKRAQFICENMVPPNGKTAAENICDSIYNYIMR